MNKKINISIVGTGLMGLQHIKAISKSKKANLHSIVDISNNAKNLSKKYKIPLYSNVEELLVFNKIDKIDKASLNFLQEKYESAIFVSSIKQTNLDQLISAITYKIFGNLIEVKLLTSPKHLDTLHKFSTIKNVVNKEDQLEVEVSIRNYYLNNLVKKEVVKILS